MCEIEDAMKKPGTSVRLECGSRWMVWRDWNEKGWVVLERTPWPRSTKSIIETHDKQAALRALTGEDENAAPDAA